MDFGNTFLAELLAGLSVAVIATLFVPWYLNWQRIKSGKLYLCFYDRTQTYKISPTNGGDYESTFLLTIKNSTPFSLRDVQLNIYLPNTFTTSIEEKVSEYGDISGGPVPAGYMVACTLKKPIFPRRYYNVPFKIKIKANKNDFGDKSEENIYYYFSTEKGVFPRTAEFINEERSIYVSEFDKLSKLTIKRS